MNTRITKKQITRRADKDALDRLEAKMDLVLGSCERRERQSVFLGAVSGGIAGGVLAVVITYAKVLYGLR